MVNWEIFFLKYEYKILKIIQKLIHKYDLQAVKLKKIVGIN